MRLEIDATEKIPPHLKGYFEPVPEPKQRTLWESLGW